MQTVVKVDKQFLNCVSEVTEKHGLNSGSFKRKVERALNRTKDRDQKYDRIIKLALENIDEAEPDWTFVASEFYLKELYEQAMENRTGKEDAEAYTNLYGLTEKLVDRSEERRVGKECS